MSLSVIKNQPGALIKLSRPHPLNGRTRGEFIELLKETLQGRVSEAYIFGSVALNEITEDSDADVILVVDTKLDFFKRLTLFPELFTLAPRLDVLVYTPEEFAKIKSEPRIGFWKSVFESMLPIITAKTKPL